MEQPPEHERTVVGKASVGEPPQQEPAASRALRRLGVGIVLFVLGASAGGAAVHFLLERPALDAAQARLDTYEQELAAMRGRLKLADSATAALEGRLLVEESTRRGLETTLGTLQAEFGRAQDSLAFYEQLIPPGPNGAVTVRALDIERAGPHLRYRVLLMRSGSHDKPFQGSLQFLADGHLDGQKASASLLPITVQGTDDGGASKEAVQVDAAKPEAGLMAVEFADFQRSSGVLGLPPGFVPESVTINVLEGRTLRTSRSVDLSVAE